ncbi:MAG TPA: hypothetical protein VIJ92_06805, partial [Ginsengibacter sp.]
MKKFILFITFCAVLKYGLTQPSNSNPADTLKLIPQKENIITAQTIVKSENIGPKINTEYDELRPTISSDGNLLFFIRQNDPHNTQVNVVPNSQDIWFSERDSSGNWSKAVHLGRPLNTSEYNAVFWISPDNNRILIRNAYIDGDYFGDGVSMCYLTKYGNWSKPQMLQIKNYEKYNRGNQYGATMASDGQTLLLYMSEKDGSFNNDIYVCFLQKDGSWSEPKSLGKKINLPKYNEMTPYLAPDGITLYFSSDRPGGLEKWTDPVNLGAPINTPDWDAFFTLDAGGEYAYMTTDQDSYGASDIVRIKLLEKEKPNPVLLVSGNVYDSKTKLPLSASLVYETLPDGTEAGNGISNPLDGSFKIVLPYDKNYSIRATADHYFAI